MLLVQPLTDIPAAHEVSRAAWVASTPDIPFDSPAAFADMLREPRPGSEYEHYEAVLDGVVVGFLELGLPQLENLGVVNLVLAVHPAYRRRGAGRALHALAVERTRLLGRKHLTGLTVHSADFAAALGAAPGLELMRSRLLTTDPAALPAEPSGYRLVQWSGAAPAAYLDDLAYLDGRLHQDAPVGDLDREPDKVDAARIRAAEEALCVRRRTSFHTAAVHQATGRLVAWTMLASPDATPWQAWQYITLVDPDHRGHRLGPWIKIENLRYALGHRPELRALDTLNATGNERILAINRAMGFRPVEAWTHWQQTV